MTQASVGRHAQVERATASARPWAARLKQALAWAVGLGLLAWLLHHTPLQDARAALARPDALTWGLTLLGLLASYGLRAARLQVVLDLDQHHAPPRRWLGVRTDALRVILMHNAAVNLLPMRAGELSFPWLAARELQHPMARAVACLLWMRLQDLTVLCTLGLLMWPGLPMGWRLGGIGLVVAGWLVLHRLLHKQAQRLARNNDTGWRRLLGKLRTALVEPAHHRPAAWLLTAANWSLKLAVGALLMSSICQAPWLSAWAGALGGELAAIVPLQGPAGFGTYEAGVWAGMASSLPSGSPALKIALGAALALHLCFLVCAVVAGALAWWLGRLRPSQRAGVGAPHA